MSFYLFNKNATIRSCLLPYLLLQIKIKNTNISVWHNTNEKVLETFVSSESWSCPFVFLPLTLTDLCDLTSVSVECSPSSAGYSILSSLLLVSLLNYSADCVSFRMPPLQANEKVPASQYAIYHI